MRKFELQINDLESIRQKTRDIGTPRTASMQRNKPLSNGRTYRKTQRTTQKHVYFSRRQWHQLDKTVKMALKSRKSKDSCIKTRA